MNKNIAQIKTYNFITKLKKLPFVKKIILFGSRARGVNKIKSDIDIAIECRNCTLTQWQEVLDIIENADTLLLIDCVNLDQVDENLKTEILKDGIEL